MGENIFLAKISTYTVANNIIIMNIVYINTCRHLHSMGEYYVDGGGEEKALYVMMRVIILCRLLSL